MSTLDVAVVVYTYDRTDDARINMEIVRHTWGAFAGFASVRIVHAFDGESAWWPEPYLEDDLVALPNPGHAPGAAELIDAGIGNVHERSPETDYVVVVAADTWNVDPAYVHGLLTEMRRGGRYLATCPWGAPTRNDPFLVGLAADYFVVDAAWARTSDMFPLDYTGFDARYGDLLLYWGGGTVQLEFLLLARFLRAVYAEHRFAHAAELRGHALARLQRMTDREPVHSHVDERGAWIRSSYWPRMGLVTHHEPARKRAVLRERGVRGSVHVERLVSADDLSYFNRNAPPATASVRGQ